MTKLVALGKAALNAARLYVVATAKTFFWAACIAAAFCAGLLTATQMAKPIAKHEAKQFAERLAVKS